MDNNVVTASAVVVVVWLLLASFVVSFFASLLGVASILRSDLLALFMHVVSVQIQDH